MPLWSPTSLIIHEQNRPDLQYKVVHLNPLYFTLVYHNLHTHGHSLSHVFAPMACHLHLIYCTWDAVTTCPQVTVFSNLGAVRVIKCKNKNKSNGGFHSSYLLMCQAYGWDIILCCKIYLAMKTIVFLLGILAVVGLVWFLVEVLGK